MFTRNCPLCGKLQTYAFVTGLIRANTENRKCKSCIRKMRNRERWGEQKSLVIQCPTCKKYRKFKTRESARHSERKNSICITCQKVVLKLKTAQWIAKHGGGARYNPKACDIFREIENELGWCGMFAEKNKEFFISDLGYWVDYYEPNKNIIIEYDEPRHSLPKQQEKDRIRQIRIENHLKCKFYRILEGQNWRTIINV